MNAELLERAYAAGMASVAEGHGAGDMTALKAVLRVAIEACAARIDSHRKEMQRRERDEREVNGKHYDYYLARRHEAEFLVAQIRALLTDAGAANAQPDAS